MVSKKDDDSKLFAFLAILLSIIGFLIALFAKKNNKYVMFYAKQSLVLFIAWVVLWGLSFILLFIPVIGSFIHWIIYLGMIILWVIGLIYSLSGEMKEIPILGQFAKKINI